MTEGSVEPGISVLELDDEESWVSGLPVAGGEFSDCAVEDEVGFWRAFLLHPLHCSTLGWKVTTPSWRQTPSERSNWSAASILM